MKNTRYSELLNQFVDTESLDDFEITLLKIRNKETIPTKKDINETIHELKKRIFKLNLIMQDNISESPIFSVNTHTEMNKSKALKVFMESILTHQKKPNFNKPSFIKLCSKYFCDDDELIGGIRKTAYTTYLHEELCYELWHYLLRSSGRKSYEFLFNHAYQLTIDAFKKGTSKSIPSAELQSDLAEKMHIIIIGNRKKGTNMTRFFIRTPCSEEGDDSNNCYNEIGIMITDVMIETIAKLRFLKYMSAM